MFINLWAQQFYKEWGFYPIAGGTLGDGSTWDETTPVDGTLVSAVDDHIRDVRVGVRSRLALEHEWPSSDSATSPSGKHKFITLQNQAAKPSIAGTQLAALYTKTVGAGLQELYFENEAGTEVQMSNRGNVKLPSGAVLQTVSTIANTSITISATVPIDNTIPQTSEGTAIISKAITVNDATNPVEISGVMCVNLPENNDASVIALFLGTTANAIYSMIHVGQFSQAIPYKHVLTGGVGTTGAITIYVRIGKRTGEGNSTLNTYTGTSVFGGALISNLILKELKS